jgi:transposase
MPLSRLLAAVPGIGPLIALTLVPGATAAIRHARLGAAGASPWLLALLARKPRKLAAVARTNKIARIGDTPRSLLRGAPVWAMMARGEARRWPTHATA